MRVTLKYHDCIFAYFNAVKLLLFFYHRHYSLGQNTCTALLLIKVYFCIQEYLQQAQDLVENESILLQTLGKEKTEIHVNSRAPCAHEHSPYLRKFSYLPIREILVIT